MRCSTCSRGKRKCDQLKPVCGRCSRLGKSCSYSLVKDETENQMHPNISMKCKESCKYGRLRHKATNTIMTVEDAIKKIGKENNIHIANNITMGSIILSSPMNRITIFEFIKGSNYKKHAKSTLDKSAFQIHLYSNRQKLEIIW